ncbi:uncharacterized protein [Enoplosus armatus]|uniref:uncharacterized protein n=1 Tax=Enoplosus armatus TaxID=215367 RepID=UPI00399602ED
MASTLVLLLQLLLVSLASASHRYGGAMTFTYKGRNPNGTLRVVLRNRATFDGCQSSHNWYCNGGNCGRSGSSQRGVLDRSTNTPQRNNQWCETETVSTRNVPSDKPFQMRAASCCWIRTRNSVSSWRLLTYVDLGTRSDTGKPNKSPDVAILPFLRVPQNCPRTYKLMSFDPDGDKVRCRYGNAIGTECGSCSQPSGFHLDQASCTLHYQNSYADSRVYGFEMVVEDFPQGSITLTYSDGSRSRRAPLTARRKKQATTWPPPTTAAQTTSPWWWHTTTPSWWHYTTPSWWHSTTTAPTTTAVPTTSPWWWHSTTPWWWHSTTTAPTTTTTAVPTTTTAATTTAVPTTTTWWWHTTTPWWWHSTTTEPTTTTTAVPTTTTWWWHTTTPSWWHSTTTAPTTTTQAPTLPLYTTRHLRATTPPLSKLPLQFSLLVDPAAPSCQEGLYLPKFVHPTPDNGARIQAEVNKEVEIRVKARATYARIHDMIISGPLNVSKHRTTHDEFVIRWKPAADDLGDHYPICFAVEAVTGSAVTIGQSTQHYHHHPTPSSQSGIYQSDMRCVLVDIGKEQVKANVICNQSSMMVEVEKSLLSGLHEDHLRLNDPTNMACSLQTHSNSTHVIAVVPLNACGTQIEEDDDNLIFKNEITTVDNKADLITRKHLLEVQFYCQYPKRGNMTLGFTAHRKNVTVWEKGFGKFTYQFEFYPNNRFQTMIDPNSYPLEYDIGSRIYMQIEATSSVNNTELFVESCRAAPYDNPNYRPTYSIIENGCKVDSTVQVYSPAHENQFKFSMEAFKFIGLHDQVYISCSVLMCEAGEPNTRCSKGCMNSTWPIGHRHHRKREAVTETGKHLVSQGPLRLRRSAESTRSSVTSLNLNLVFIAGCLLAAVGMISAVAMFKAKMSSVKYQPLPVFEN